MWSSLIGAGSSLLGGIFGRNDAAKAQAQQNAYNAPDKIRERAEKGGFNPLLFVGPGVGNQAAPRASGHMGNAIANAGLAMADGMDRNKQLQIERDRLEMDQKKLTALLEQNTIRPKSGGIYSGMAKTSAIGTGEGALSNAPQIGLKMRPKSATDLWGRGSIRVVGPDGGAMEVPKKWADRLGIVAGDALMAEDYEAFLGDELGQVAALPKLPSAMLQLEGGLFTPRTPEERSNIAKSPFTFGSYFPSVSQETVKAKIKAKYRKLPDFSAGTSR